VNHRLLSEGRERGASHASITVAHQMMYDTVQCNGVTHCKFTQGNSQTQPTRMPRISLPVSKVGHKAQATG